MPHSTSPTKRPPFRSPPLPQAGHSGRLRVFDRMTKEIVWLFAVVALVGVVGGLNLGLRIGRDFGQSISSTLLWIFFGCCVLAIGIMIVVVNRRVNAAVAQFDNETLGILGERIVADAIEELKSEGYRIFHSVPPEVAGGGDFDHVVIGPKGVFVLETKTYSKNEGANNEIVITADGRALVNGREQDRCPISQAKALRDAMRRFLERETGQRDVYVRGVVMFPGWYVKDEAYRDNNPDFVWTLKETAFAKWLRNKKEPVRLSASDIALFAARLEDHVRRAQKSAENDG